jgi:DNA polymerase I-like protein with 3'-5' exonuclease and polymerase domains
LKKNLKKPVWGIKKEWIPPQELPAVPAGVTEIAIDLETQDPRLKTHGPGWPTGNGDVCGIAVAWEGYKGYFPIGHEGGGNIDRRLVLRWFKKEIAAHEGKKIFHNAAYDVGWLKHLGINLSGQLVDTMIAAPLIDENRRFYSLNSIGYDYLGEMKSETSLREAAAEFGLDAKAELWRLPASCVGEYAEQDAKMTLDLWQHFKSILNKEDLWQIFELESSVLPICIDMTWKGIRVNLDAAERVKQNQLKAVKKIISKIKKDTGVDVELWSAASVSKVFDFYKIPYSRTATGMPSFTKNFLRLHGHPAAQLIADGRELDKTGNTFISSIFRYTHKGRIHGHINQLRSESGGTVTGRISMANPNLQQIPARNPKISELIRGLFLPEQGEKWASIDFDQQEPRILVHFSSFTNRGLQGSEDFVKAYRDSANTDFHQLVADLAEIPRTQAKTINLGIMYGMGQTRLAEQLDVTVEEAKALMKTYHREVPFVRELQDTVQRTVSSHLREGYVRSLLGRKCRFDLWEPNLFVSSRALPREEAVREYGTNLKRAYTYKALNRLIQSSAADQTKAAMVNVFKEKRKTPLVQVHDELAFSVTEATEARDLRKIMEDAVQLAVPCPAAIKIGENWGMLHAIGE